MTYIAPSNVVEKNQESATVPGCTVHGMKNPAVSLVMFDRNHPNTTFSPL